MAEKYDFDYELVTYSWPHWLRAQTEKQRIIWAYKILFLDVLFPLDLDKVIFVDADQVSLENSFRFAEYSDGFTHAAILIQWIHVPESALDCANRYEDSCRSRLARRTLWIHAHVPGPQGDGRVPILEPRLLEGPSPGQALSYLGLVCCGFGSIPPNASWRSSSRPLSTTFTRPRIARQFRSGSAQQHAG